MTLVEIYDLIKFCAFSQPNVHSVVEAFTDLNREDAEYSAIICQQNQHTHSEEFMTYNFYLGYADKLNDKSDNDVEIQSTGINILNNIINVLNKNENIYATHTDFVTTTEKFEAETAVVYCSVSINVPDMCYESESPFKPYLKDYYTKPETRKVVDNAISNQKFKTINHLSILGDGNIEIRGGGGAGSVDFDINVLFEHVGEDITDEATIRQALMIDDTVDLFDYICELKTYDFAALRLPDPNTDVVYHLPIYINYITDTSATVAFGVLQLDGQMSVIASADKRSSTYTLSFDYREIDVVGEIDNVKEIAESKSKVNPRYNYGITIATLDEGGEVKELKVPDNLNLPRLHYQLTRKRNLTGDAGYELVTPEKYIIDNETSLTRLIATSHDDGESKEVLISFKDFDPTKEDKMLIGVFEADENYNWKLNLKSTVGDTIYEFSWGRQTSGIRTSEAGTIEKVVKDRYSYESEGSLITTDYKPDYIDFNVHDSATGEPVRGLHIDKYEFWATEGENQNRIDWLNIASKDEIEELKEQIKQLQDQLAELKK